VGLGDVIYAGSHGQEIEFPGGRRFENPDSLRAVPSLAEAERLLRSRLVGLAGIAVERKPFAIAVHTRNAVSEAARVSAGLITSNLAEEVGGLVVRKGKEIHEVRPDVDWDKGRAIQYLMGLVDGHTPLFVGDDDTDEDGFAVVREAGGVGVIVAVGDERLTSADYRIDLQGGVVEFLAGF
jgi:trehalose 6-phosphate phosphatase